MKRIILITGGERSGKSTFGERMALMLSDTPVYMATAHVWDEEFRERVRIHKERRGPQWTNIEEEKHLSRHKLTGRTVLVDCVTLWATNYFFDQRPAEVQTDDPTEQIQTEQRQVEESLHAIQQEFDRLTAQKATFIFVTNEIGLGGVSPDRVQRRFTDLLGRMNQYIAARADEVILMVSGIPVKIK